MKRAAPPRDSQDPQDLKAIIQGLRDERLACLARVTEIDIILGQSGGPHSARTGLTQAARDWLALSEPRPSPTNYARARGFVPGNFMSVVSNLRKRA